MIIETLVLDGDKSMLEIFRDLIQCLVNTVGTGCHETLDLGLPVVRVDKSGVSRWLYIRRGNLRCIIQDLFDKNTAANNAGDSHKKQTKQKCLEKSYANPLSLHGGFGRDLFLPLGRFFLTIIHARLPPLYQVIITNNSIEIKKKMKTSHFGRKNLRNSV